MPKQNYRYYADDIVKLIFVIQNCFISIQNSLKFVPESNEQYTSICLDNDWRHSDKKPLSEQRMAYFINA